MLKRVENKVEKVVTGASAAVTNARDAVTGAIDSRAHTVTVRLDNDSLKCVDEMVRAEVVPDRSAAVAYLVKQGITVSADLLDKIQEGFDRIEGIEPSDYEDVAEELYNRSAELQNRLAETSVSGVPE